MRTASDGDFICRLPGRLKQDRQQTDIVAVGDHVAFSIQDEESNLIESVMPRKNALSRTRPSAHNRQLSSDREQVLVANVDQVVFVFALKKPSTNIRKLDRLLVVAERQQIPAVICVNKIDLGKPGEAAEQFRPYTDIGYPAIFASAQQEVGVDELRDLLIGRVSVLAGSSGVGKSSLLNAVSPGLGLKVSNVSRSTGKGMHTTRYAELISLDEIGGGYVADTPGIRGWALYDIEPDELDGYFREMAPLVPDCQFSDCTHRHEPGCAIRAAVAEGSITAARYDSYLRLREEHEALETEAY